MVDGLGGGGALELGDEGRVVEEALEQRLDARVVHVLDDLADGPQVALAGVGPRRRVEVGQVERQGVDLVDGVDLELRAALEQGGRAVDLDEVAAGEQGVHLLEVLPDAGVEIAALVAQHDGQEGLAVLGGGERLARDEEDRLDGLLVVDVLGVHLGHGGPPSFGCSAALLVAQGA